MRSVGNRLERSESLDANKQNFSFKASSLASLFGSSHQKKQNTSPKAAINPLKEKVSCSDSIKKQLSHISMTPSSSNALETSYPRQRNSVRRSNSNSAHQSFQYYAPHSFNTEGGNETDRYSSQKRGTPTKRSYENLSYIALNEQIASLTLKIEQKDKELLQEKQKSLNFQRLIRQYQEQVQNATSKAKSLATESVHDPSIAEQKYNHLNLAYEEMKKCNKELQISLRQETLSTEGLRTQLEIIKGSTKEHFLKENVASFVPKKNDIGSSNFDSSSKYKDLENALAESIQRTKQIQNISDSYQSKNIELDEKLAEANHIVKGIKAENENLIEERNRLIDYIEKHEINNKFVADINKCKRNSDNFQKKCEGLQELNAQSEKDKIKLNKKCQTLSEERENILQILREREMLINKKIQVINDLRSEVEDLRKECELSRENFSVAQISLLETQEELEKNLARNQDLEKEVGQLENYIEIMKAEKNNVENQKIDDLKQKIHALLQL